MPVNPEDITRMEESYVCSGCDKLVMEIEFKNNEKAEVGCHCEVGGEAGVS